MDEHDIANDGFEAFIEGYDFRNLMNGIFGDIYREVTGLSEVQYHWEIPQGR